MYCSLCFKANPGCPRTGADCQVSLAACRVDVHRYVHRSGQLVRLLLCFSTKVRMFSRCVPGLYEVRIRLALGLFWACSKCPLGLYLCACVCTAIGHGCPKKGMFFWERPLPPTPPNTLLNGCWYWFRLLCKNKINSLNIVYWGCGGNVNSFLPPRVALKK